MKTPGSRYSTLILLARRTALLAIGFVAGFYINGKMGRTHPLAQSPAATPPASVPVRPADLPAASPSTTAPEANLEIVDLTTRQLTRDDTGLVIKTPMTPELARTLLAKVKSENKDINERALLCASILHALSKSGHVNEAWLLLEESPGTVRVMEIGMLFQTDQLPLQTLLARLGELTDPDERTNALRGIMMTRPSEIVNIDFSTIPMESEAQQRAALGSIISALQTTAKEKDPATGEAIMVKLFELVSTGKMDAKHLNLVLDADYGVDPFRRWEILGGMKEGFSPADAERFRAQGVPTMIRADMDKAMKLLCTDSQSKYSVPILNKAITTMYQADPEQANNWISSNLATIDPATGQRVIMCVGQAAIRSGELVTARQWADQLLNPGVKDQLLKQIEAATKPGDGTPR